jgi:hypothetical protein
MPYTQLVNTAAFDPSGQALQDQIAMMRQQQLAQMMEQQAFQPIQSVNPNSKLSPLQGLTKMLEAYTAGKAYNKSDEMMVQSNQRQNALLDQLVGLGPTSAARGPVASQPQQSADVPSSVGAAMGGGGDVPQTLSGALAPTPSGSGGGSGGPALPSLTGDPVHDRVMIGSLGLPKYAELAAAQYAPTDFVKSLIAAGIDPKSRDGQMAILQNLQKQNYTAPNMVRPGSVLVDPYSRQPVFQNPNLPEGAQATWGANGMPNNVQMLPGATQAIQGAEQAQQTGRTLGGVVQVPQAGGGPPMPVMGSQYFPGQQPAGAQAPPAPSAAPAAGASPAAPTPVGSAPASGPTPPPTPEQKQPSYWEGVNKFQPPTGIGSQPTETLEDVKAHVAVDTEVRKQLGQTAVSAMNQSRNNMLMLPHLANTTVGAGSEMINAARSVLAHTGFVPQSELGSLTDTEIANKYLSRNGTEGLLARYGRVTQGEVQLAVTRQAPNLTQQQQSILSLTAADEIKNAYDKQKASDYIQYRTQHKGDARDFDTWYTEHHSIDDFAKQNGASITQKVVQTYKGAAPAIGTQQPQRPGQTSAPTQVKSDADYAALPSGATYIAPDGSTRTKR